MTCVTMNVDPIGPIICATLPQCPPWSTLWPPGVVPLAMTAGGYNLKTIFKAGMVPAVVRGVVSVLATMTMFPI